MNGKKVMSLFMAAAMSVSMLIGCGSEREGSATAPATEETAAIINSLKAGNGMPATEVTANNGVIDVAIYELPPVVVTKDNAKEVFANDPGRMVLLK